MKKIFSILTATIIIMITSTITAMAVTPRYIPLGVPAVNTSWKTWMDQKYISDRSSAQYKLLRNWMWMDSNGFCRISGERDLGITDDYYCVAMGSYYGITMGTKYRVTTDTGRVFYAIQSEAKGTSELNSTRQYGAANKDIFEFLINYDTLMKSVKKAGNANVYSPLNGSIIKIERIEFE